METKTKYLAVEAKMNRVNALRAAVRPIVILYCTGILGALVLLEATGGTAPSSEISKEIIWAFIGITGALDVEYAGERAVTEKKEQN